MDAVTSVSVRQEGSVKLDHSEAAKEHESNRASGDEDLNESTDTVDDRFTKQPVDCEMEAQSLDESQDLIEDGVPLKPQSNLKLKISLNKKKSKKSKLISGSIEDWVKPFSHGWFRELVIRNTQVDPGNKPRNADVYYRSPTGKKLRSRIEIDGYLKANPDEKVDISCFTFVKDPIYREPFETVRTAGRYPGPFSSKSDTETSPKPAPGPKKRKLPETESSTQQQKKLCDNKKPIKIQLKLPESKPPETKKIVSESKETPPAPPPAMKSAPKKSTNTNTDRQNKLCGMDCPGRKGIPPSLHCDVCMCMFHPECVKHDRFKSGSFVCKMCSGKDSKAAKKMPVTISPAPVSSMLSPTLPPPPRLKAAPNIPASSPLPVVIPKATNLSSSVIVSQANLPNCRTIVVVTKAMPISSFSSVTSSVGITSSAFHPSRIIGSIGLTSVFSKSILPVTSTVSSAGWVSSIGLISPVSGLLTATAGLVNSGLMPSAGVVPPTSVVIPSGGSVVSSSANVVQSGCGVASASVVLPSAGSVLSSAGSVLPSAGSVLPSAGSVLSSAGSVLPSAGSVLPSTGSVPPSAESELPSAGGVPSSADSVLPSASGLLPSAGGVLPSADSVLPSAASVLPSASGLFPSASGLLPSAGGLLPSASVAVGQPVLTSPATLPEGGRETISTSQSPSLAASCHSTTSKATPSGGDANQISPPAQALSPQSEPIKRLENGAQQVMLPNSITRTLDLRKPLHLKVEGAMHVVLPTFISETAEGVQVLLPQGSLPRSKGQRLEFKMTNAAVDQSQNMTVFDSGSHVKEAQEAALAKRTEKNKNADLPNPALTPLLHMHGGFVGLLTVFEHLPLLDLLRASEVCRTWHKAARLCPLWQEVRFRDMKILDWKKALRHLSSCCTRVLDLRGIVSRDNLWTDFTSSLCYFGSLQRVNLAQCPPSVLHAVFKKWLSVTHVTASLASDATEEELDCTELVRLQALERIEICISTASLKCSSLPELAKLPELKALSISGLKNGTSADFEFLGGLSHLSSLEIGDCSAWSAQNYNTLATLTKLELLRLECGSDLDEPCLGEVLAKLPVLTDLALIRFELGSKTARMMHTLHQLRSLSIWPQSNKMAEVNTNTLLSVSGMDFLWRFVWGIVGDSNISRDYIPFLSVQTDTRENVLSEETSVSLRDLLKKICISLPHTTIRMFHVPAASASISTIQNL